MDQPTLLGIAALVTATSGIASTIWAIRKDRKVEHEECEQRLKDTRAEAERLAQELHELRMQSLETQ